MKKLMLLAIVVVAVACDAGEARQELDTAALTKGLWVKLDSAWQPSPPESGFTSSAYARVLRFEPDGQFSWIACMLLRNGEKTTISPGDGQVFFFGRWKAAGNRAHVEYVKAREVIHVAGSDQPFEKKRVATAESTGDRVIFEGLRFTRSFAPDESAYDEMVNGVRKWEAAKLRPFFGNE
jgi:hypothetical protein